MTTTPSSEPSTGTTDDAESTHRSTEGEGTAETPVTSHEDTASVPGTTSARSEDDGLTSSTDADEGRGMTSSTDQGLTSSTDADRGQGMTSPTDQGQGTAAAPTDDGQQSGMSDEQLISRESAMDFKTRWEAIQQGFVDDPRSAVSDADSLVSDVLQQLSNGFDEQHGQLEAQWNDGEPDTEQLRSALRRYRDFFDRLLTL